MNETELQPRALLAGLLMGSACFAVVVAVLIAAGAMDPRSLELETGPFVGYLLVVLLAASSVGGSLWGYTLSQRGVGRSVSWSVVAATGAVMLLFFAPEAPTVEEAYSDHDAQMDPALELLESARQHAAEGEHEQALRELMQGREMVHSGISPQSEIYCLFGEQVVDVADALVETGGVHEARMAYAIAFRFAQDCEGLDRGEILSRRESARGRAAIAE
jgi:hypothetical protein